MTLFQVPTRSPVSDDDITASRRSKPCDLGNTDEKSSICSDTEKCVRILLIKDAYISKSFFYQSWGEFGRQSTVSTMVLVSKIVVTGIYTKLTQV